MPAQPLLEARDLVKDFGSVRVIHGVSLKVMRGETLGLVGESGSGKSTIVRLLLRLIEPTSGSVLFHDTSESNSRTFDLLQLNSRDMRRLRRRLSIVFQDPYAALNPRMSVSQILAEPFAIHREQPPQGLEGRLHELLAEVGLEPSALRRYPHEFSGGSASASTSPAPSHSALNSSFWTNP